MSLVLRLAAAVRDGDQGLGSHPGSNPGPDAREDHLAAAAAAVRARVRALGTLDPDPAAAAAASDALRGAARAHRGAAAALLADIGDGLRQVGSLANSLG